LNRDPVRLLEERLDIIKDAQQATIRRDNQHRIKFLINPNIYEIVFSPISEEFIEVNLFAYRIESDIIRDPDGKESDVLVSVLNAVFKTWVKQGVIDYWEAEDSPTYSENIRNSLFNTYANASKIIVFEPLRRIRHMSIDWLTRNWKQIVATVIIIILTAVLTPIIQRSLFDPHSP